MPSFFDRISNKFQAPRKENSEGGGSVSPEARKIKDTDIQVDKTFVSGDGKRKIRITCVDPLSAYEYSREATAGIHLYNEDFVKAKAEMIKELDDGGFTPEPPKEKKKPKADTDEGTVTVPSVEGDVSQGDTQPIDSVGTPSAGVAVENDGEASTSTPLEGEAELEPPVAATLDVPPTLPAELAPLKDELDSIIEWHTEELERRVKRGWISAPEEKTIRDARTESERIIKEAFSLLPQANLPLEDARTTLEKIRDTLPLAEMYRANEVGLKFFVERKGGAREEEMIGEMLLAAKREYKESFGGVKLKGEGKFWEVKVLPILEKEILDYMNETTVHEDKKEKGSLNRGALNAILSKVARAPLSTKRTAGENPIKNEGGPLSSEDQVFALAQKQAFDVVAQTLQEARRKKGLLSEGATTPAAGAPTDVSDAAITTAGEKDNDRSKVVADLISRPGKTESVMMRANMLTEEWETFLARPDGKETATMLQDMVTKEWEAFDQKISQEADTRGAFISKQEKLRLWKALLLPQLKESILEYLETKKSIPRRNGGLIFRAMIRELEGVTENKK